MVYMVRQSSNAFLKMEEKNIGREREREREWEDGEKHFHLENLPFTLCYNNLQFDWASFEGEQEEE